MGHPPPPAFYFQYICPGFSVYFSSLCCVSYAFKVSLKCKVSLKTHKDNLRLALCQLPCLASAWHLKGTQCVHSHCAGFHICLIVHLIWGNLVGTGKQAGEHSLCKIQVVRNVLCYSDRLLLVFFSEWIGKINSCV